MPPPPGRVVFNLGRIIIFAFYKFNFLPNNTEVVFMLVTANLFHFFKYYLMKGWQDGSVSKELAAKPDDLSSIPRTYIVEKESQLQQVVFFISTCALWHTCSLHKQIYMNIR